MALIYYKSVKLYYMHNIITTQKVIEKWKSWPTEKFHRIENECILRYLIIDNPISPDALLNQDKPDKTPWEVR